MMTSRRILLLGSLALPVVAAYGCGGKVFLDSGASSSSSGGNPSKDASVSDSSMPVVPGACSSTPQVLAQSAETIVSIVAGDAYAAFTTKLGEGPESFGTVALRLSDGASWVVRQADRPAIQRDGALLALAGNNLIFSSSTSFPPLGALAVDLVSDWNRDSARSAFSTNSELLKFSSSSDGVVFGISQNRDPQLTRGEAWEFTYAPGLPEHAPTYYTHEAGVLSDISAFVGGFAALTKGGKDVYVGLRSKKETQLFRSMPGCKVAQQVRALKTSPAGSAFVYTLRRSPCAEVVADEIVRDECTIDMQGVRACPDEIQPPSLEESNQRSINAFDVLPDGSVVAAVTDQSGVRPIGQLIWAHNAAKVVIGGEGVTGTVDAITAVTTHGNCVYWAEKSTQGNRIMRVAR